MYIHYIYICICFLFISYIYLHHEQYPELLVRNLSNDFICVALTIILQYNTFLFNQVNYIQIRGTAMGTKVAPTYVTLLRNT